MGNSRIKENCKFPAGSIMKFIRNGEQRIINNPNEGHVEIMIANEYNSQI